MALVARDLGDEDVDALQDLIETNPAYAEALTGYPPGPSDALSTLIGLPPGADLSDKVALGLWDDGELVGFADVLLGYPDAGVASLGLLMIRNDRQGRGLGRHLHDMVVQRVEEHAAARRLRVGVVGTVAATVEPFFRAVGYEPTAVVKPYRYDHVTSTTAVWERPLPRPSRTA
jgi:GNAT superfamily N-acetyltransferase